MLNKCCTEKGVSVLSKERLTKRIDLGNGKYSVDFANDIVGEFLNDHKKGVKALFHKLAEYEDLEEQGLLLRLPCKLGDKIYIVTKYHYQDIDMSTHEDIEEIEVENIVFGRPYWQINYDEHEFLPEDFGKTVFLTQSAAEKKLRELEEK